MDSDFFYIQKKSPNGLGSHKSTPRPPRAIDTTKNILTLEKIILSKIRRIVYDDGREANHNIYFSFCLSNYSMSNFNEENGSSIKSPKISELISSHKNSEYGSKPFVSIEFFPPKTESGINSLFSVLNKLTLVKHPNHSALPLFIDFTWGAGGSTSELTLDLCKKSKEDYGAVCNMHLTCTNVTRDTIDSVLTKCIDLGITNILALRGDPPMGFNISLLFHYSVKNNFK